MAKRFRNGTVRIKIASDPVAATELELHILGQRPEFQTDCIVGGGKTPPDMLRENEAARRRLAVASAELIARRGLIREFAQKELQKLAELKRAIVGPRRRLADLQAVCKHESQAKGVCTDCHVRISKRRFRKK